MKHTCVERTFNEIRAVINREASIDLFKKIWDAATAGKSCSRCEAPLPLVSEMNSLDSGCREELRLKAKREVTTKGRISVADGEDG